MKMTKNYSAILACLVLAVGCNAGKVAKDEADKVSGNGKKDEPKASFKADLNQIRGGYALIMADNSFDATNSVVLYFNNETLEIASRSESFLKSCAAAQPVSLDANNMLKIEPIGACPSVEFEITNQGIDFVYLKSKRQLPCVNGPDNYCSGFLFRHVDDLQVGQWLFGWDAGKKYAPILTSLGLTEANLDAVSAARSEMKSELALGTVTLHGIGALWSHKDLYFAHGQKSDHEPFRALIAPAGTVCHFQVVSTLAPGVAAGGDDVFGDGQKYPLIGSQMTDLLRKGGVSTLSFNAHGDGVPMEISEKVTEIDRFANNRISFSALLDQNKVSSGVWTLDCDRGFDKDQLAHPITMADIKEAVGTFMSIP